MNTSKCYFCVLSTVRSNWYSKYGVCVHITHHTSAHQCERRTFVILYYLYYLYLYLYHTTQGNIYFDAFIKYGCRHRGQLRFNHRSSPPFHFQPCSYIYRSFACQRWWRPPKLLDRVLGQPLALAGLFRWRPRQLLLHEPTIGVPNRNMMLRGLEISQ